VLVRRPAIIPHKLHELWYSETHGIRYHVKILRVRFVISLSSPPRCEPEFPKCPSHLVLHSIRHLPASGLISVQHARIHGWHQWARFWPCPVRDSPHRESQPIPHSLVVWLLQIWVSGLTIVIPPGYVANPTAWRCNLWCGHAGHIGRPLTLHVVDDLLHHRSDLPRQIIVQIVPKRIHHFAQILSQNPC
jgi:hypothetical protein